MTETVATTTSFTLPIDEIIEEAYDNLGGELVSGYDARSARRALNLLMLDLQNREFPLFHLEQRSVAVVTGNTEITLGEDVIAILDVMIVNSDGVERQLNSVSVFDYFNLTGKTRQTPPSNYALDNTRQPARVFLYPAADAAYTLKYWVMRRHKDITKSYELLDIQSKYLPAITMGLSYFLSFKKKKEFGLSPQDIMDLKNEYEERLNRAFDMDRDRNDVILYPAVKRGD